VEIFPLDTVAKRGRVARPSRASGFRTRTQTHSVVLISLHDAADTTGFREIGNGGDRKRADFRAKQNGTGPGFSEWRIRAAVYRTGKRVVGSKVPYADVIVG